MPLTAGSLWELVEARAAATPDALFALDEEERELSFRGFRDAALRCAAALHESGIERDTRVSWMLPTWMHSMVLCAALARLEAVQNPILPIYRERETRFITQQSQARWLFVPGLFRGFDYAQMARGLASQNSGLQITVVDPARDLPEGDPTRLPPFAVPGTDAPVRWLYYSSGTTADPKGAKHTDRTILHSAHSMVRVLGLREDDRIALVFPLTHIGGGGWLMASLLSGAAHLVVPSFDATSSVRFLAAHGVTQATAGTAFHQAYLAAQRAQPSAPLFPNVRSFPGGGAPKPPQLHYDVKREMGGAGIVSGYGLTECPIISMNCVSDPDPKLAHTEGRATSGVQVRVVSVGGESVEAGDEGEIRVRGPQLCKGYLDASLDGAAFDEEGYFRTGDLGVVDEEGFITITGRLKDVIIRKGENISAKEVEDLLFEHELVRDVAVIGLPDDERGELCCAIVVPVDPAETASLASLCSYLRERELMVQKLPEQLEILSELPRNPTGKVLKHELRKRFSRAPSP